MRRRCRQISIAWVCTPNVRAEGASCSAGIFIERELILRCSRGRNSGNRLRTRPDKWHALTCSTHHRTRKCISRAGIDTGPFLRESPEAGHILLQGACYQIGAILAEITHACGIDCGRQKLTPGAALLQDRPIRIATIFIWIAEKNSPRQEVLLYSASMEEGCLTPSQSNVGWLRPSAKPNGSFPPMSEVAEGRENFKRALP